MEKLVSVIMPTYNRKWLLPRAIESVLTESYRNLEIILVNDGGEDVQEVVDHFNDPRIKYFQNEKNKGLAATRNVGLKNCSGDYICLLDDDDIHLQYTLEFRMYMVDKLQADIVYTRSLLDFWEKMDNGYVSKGKVLYWDSPFDRDLILTQNIAPCNCPLFSRKSWEKTNYWFDENMKTTEDHDFWAALSRNFFFHELKVVDVECTQRSDKSQMTGNLNFAKDWAITYKRWRHTAIDLDRVTRSQNNALMRAGLNPADYGL